MSSMRRIKPVWECPTHRGTIQEGPGECPECSKKLRRYVPLTDDLSTVFRCAACKKKFVEEPKVLKKGRWVCPDCGELRVHAYYCPPEYLDNLRAKKIARDLPDTDSTFRFGRSLRTAFKASDAVSQAAFRGAQLAEKLSQRRPTDGEEFIDKVRFDLPVFNKRAQMVVEMVLMKSLLEEAGLDAFVPEAMSRILAKLGPKKRED